MTAPRTAGPGDQAQFAFGDLLVTKYFETQRIAFGRAVLPAGGAGDVDPGHKDAEEVIYVISGTVVCVFPDNGETVEVSQGHALLVPPERPHKLENHTGEEACITYSCAPQL